MLVQRSTHKKKKAAIVVFRNLFDAFLKMRYKFYAQLTNGEFAHEAKDSMNVGLPDDTSNVMVQQEDAKSKRL